MAKSKTKFIKRVFILILLAVFSFAGYWVYANIFKSNVHLGGNKFLYIYIKSNATLDDVLDELYSENIIDDHKSFEWLAKEMKLSENIISGKYRIVTKMSNRSIINMIKKGKQEKVKLFFNSQIRTKEQFIDYLATKLELNQSALEHYCSNDELLQENYHLNSENFMSLIIPATYVVGWTIDMEDLFAKIKSSYDKVWTESKIAQAKNLGFSPSEISILASIVQSESSIKTEQQKIAGVYINRLHIDMRLQADPTIVFANGNYEVSRVLKVDKEIDSPYNTYRYKGLPPGPICLVNPSTIDAVLNYTKSNYLYFCAKPDFSGYSLFTRDFKVHQNNANAYREALNKKGINR